MLFVAALTVPLAPECSQPVPQTCSFYPTCVEPVLPCGATGYALGYGNKYCNAFKDKLDKFSPAGQDWIWSVMNCLQKELVPLATGTGLEQVNTCTKLRSFAYGTHPHCYTLPGHSICELPITDWFHVLGVIKKELLDVATYKQAIAVAGQCGKDLVDAIHHHFDPDLQ
ncbi:hypothetical protein EDD86DRAFT_246489 [Gorgonomyces haynaldii]|nr:hypothetical protein EDD86DRAFT_246489 [Gorgonomyces haynaldii]